jgi:hypothetical protein
VLHSQRIGVGSVPSDRSSHKLFFIGYCSHCCSTFTPDQKNNDPDGDEGADRQHGTAAFTTCARTLGVTHWGRPPAAHTPPHTESCPLLGTDIGMRGRSLSTQGADDRAIKLRRACRRPVAVHASRGYDEPHAPKTHYSFASESACTPQDVVGRVLVARNAAGGRGSNAWCGERRMHGSVRGTGKRCGERKRG